MSWSSSDPSVASVDSSGKITAISAGTAVITASASYLEWTGSWGSTVVCTADCTVTCTAKAEEAPAETPADTVTDPAAADAGNTGTDSSTDSSADKTKTKVTVGKVTGVKLTNKKGAKLAITFKKVSGAAGYQIGYSTTKTFKSAKKMTLTGTSKTIKLKKNKTYYVKVRAYKKDSTGKKVYGKWSKVVSKKMKK